MIYRYLQSTTDTSTLHTIADISNCNYRYV